MNTNVDNGLVSIAFRLLKRLVANGVHGQDRRLLLGVSIAFRLLKRLVDFTGDGSTGCAGKMSQLPFGC